MKKRTHSIIAGIILCAAAVGTHAFAQEDAAPAGKDKREQGSNKLVEKIQNFSFLDYARKLVDKLDKKERKIDPFGMPMDPKDQATSALAVAVDPEEDGPRTSLQEAVSRLRVTGVYPSRKEVVVGAQSLRVGDQVIIKHGDDSFNLEICTVETDSVELIDVDTGEKAGVSLGIVQALPSGMTRTRPVRPDTSAEDRGAIVPISRRQLTLDFSGAEDEAEDEEPEN